jgi:hypothetical protein
LVVASRDINEFVEAGVPVFDPWSSVLHVQGNKIAVKPPVTINSIPAAPTGRQRG